MLIPAKVFPFYLQIQLTVVLFLVKFYIIQGAMDVYIISCAVQSVVTVNWIWTDRVMIEVMCVWLLICWLFSLWLPTPASAEHWSDTLQCYVWDHSLSCEGTTVCCVSNSFVSVDISLLTIKKVLQCSWMTAIYINRVSNWIDYSGLMGSFFK